MAKHRKSKQRRPRRAMVTAAVAAGLSGPLVLGHAIDYTAANLDVGLANAVLGVGGKDDKLSANIPAKLSGKIGRPEWDTYSYTGIPYPADLNFEASTDAGVTGLSQAILDHPSEGVRIVGYSEGTLVAEAVKRNLAEVYDPEHPGDYDFLFIASPHLPNGGVFARFPGFRIPGFLPEFSPAEPTPFDSTYVTNEYDTYADFPAYFNPLSIANALLSVEYAHPDPYYDPIDLDTLPPDAYSKTVVPDNGAGGTDTYILVYAKHLPLLGPVRQVAAIVYLTPLTEPVLAAIEPLLRVGVDMGYTDRTNANPDKPTPFSLVTPPGKVVEALLSVPGALQQGVTDAVSAGQQSVQDAPLSTPFAAATAGDNAQLRAATEPPAAPPPEPTPAPDSTPSPEPTPSPSPEPTPQSQPAAEDTGPETKTDPEPETRTRITHPTVTSDGNKSVPTTTVAGGTTSVGGAVTEPESADEQGVSPAAAEPATPAGTPDPAGDTAADNTTDKAAA